MVLKFFNTLTRKKEILKPLKDKKVGMYTCGPTVYDFAHIGNMRAYVWEDLLRRVLTFNGFKVIHVMNITDVGHLTSDADVGEDKMEVGARREHKTAWEIAEYYTKSFFDDATKLNVLKPTIVPKATGHIKEQIELIEKLVKKGYTYIIEDGVYFDTSKLKDYGKLAKLDIEGLKAGARIEMVEGKRNPTDFALWKFSPKDKRRQMEWESPWGTGFPGWHIECSAMSMKYLGETFDIHTGGVDHIPVHHTNEIAQSEAATNKKFVNYWLHCEHLIVDGKKMSKSLGNFYTVRDIVSKGYNPIALRYFYINSHYRSQLNFTFSGLEAAQKTLGNLYNFIRKLRGIKGNKSSTKANALIKKVEKEFVEAVNDDLNMPKALASIFEFVAQMNKLADGGLIGKKNAASAVKTMLKFDEVLGLGFDKETKGELPEEVADLIKKREALRKVGDFKGADEIRDRIKNKYGIVIEDTKEGVKWKKAN